MTHIHTTHSDVEKIPVTVLTGFSARARPRC